MTLNEALKALVYEFYVEDWIYNVRERALGQADGYVGSSWDHPLVKRYAEVCKVIKEHAGKPPA